jgi:hypothetical protein
MYIQAPFMCWFSSDGLFVAKPFQEWLASEIPVVGKADGKNRPTSNDGGAVLNDMAASPAKSTKGRAGKQKN